MAKEYMSHVQQWKKNKTGTMTKLWSYLEKQVKQICDSVRKVLGTSTKKTNLQAQVNYKRSGNLTFGDKK